jgi:hypothetical protein
MRNSTLHLPISLFIVAVTLPAAAQTANCTWTPNSTSATTIISLPNCSVVIGTPPGAGAPMEINTGSAQAWIDIASANSLPPKVQFMQSAPAVLDLGIGSVNFLNSAGGVISQVSARYPGTDQTRSYMRFTTSGFERFRIDGDGNVGIGTITPTQKLTVSGVIESTSGGIKFPDGSLQTVAYPYADGLLDLTRNVTTLTSSVRNTSATGTASLLVSSGDGTSSQRQAYVQMVANEPSGRNWEIGELGASGEFRIRDVTAGNIDRMTMNANGDITFVGTVSGTSIKANFQDVAEWVETSQKLIDGTVVVLDPNRANQVIRSTRPYDTTAAGVVSSHPGLELGQPSASKALVATTGRVRVKVDATRHAIRIGDLLVTGDAPGTAMKSEPVEIGGVAMHRPGTMVGKALEPLDHGMGEILVLLSLQ